MTTGRIFGIVSFRGAATARAPTMLQRTACHPQVPTSRERRINFHNLGLSSLQYSSFLHVFFPPCFSLTPYIDHPVHVDCLALASAKRQIILWLFRLFDLIKGLPKVKSA